LSNQNHPASIKESAFECPHCGAYTTQYWHSIFAVKTKDNTPPFIPDEEYLDWVDECKEVDEATKEEWISWFQKLNKGLIWVEDLDRGKSVYLDVNNLHISKCFSCKETSVWLHKKLIFPESKVGVEPNIDLSDEIKEDINEARLILPHSSRGAAALLRLSIQKLCKSLGEKGKNIDDDIASLVKKGLDPLVQKSLDIVRVIGNEAVHPGELNIKDDPQTAYELLEIINSISDQMISNPKKINALYNRLPEGKRKGIENRDKNAKNRKDT